MPLNNQPICPHCGSRSAIPILYGDPAPEAWSAAERGELLIGGCCVEDGMPIWHCTKCNHEFGELKLNDNLKGDDLDSIMDSDH